MTTEITNLVSHDTEQFRIKDDTLNPLPNSALGRCVAEVVDSDLDFRESHTIVWLPGCDIPITIYRGNEVIVGNPHDSSFRVANV